MNTNLRRRIVMAAGACVAGAAIPVAAASSAWAETGLDLGGVDISYDGHTIFDSYDPTQTFGMSDVGTAAESGTNNDWAIVYGPSDDNVVGLANDSAGSDSNDLALYDGYGETSAPSPVFGVEGAQIVNGQNTAAEVYGGGNATINGIPGDAPYDPVSNSAAVAGSGGFADVMNDGLSPGGAPVTYDYAAAYGTVDNTGAATSSLGHGVTPSVATVYDSESATSIANYTGSNEATGFGGSAVDLSQSSYAEGTNAGSSADVVGTGTTPVVNSGEFVNDGMVHELFTSNTYQIDGIGNATFFSDLLGLNGMTAFDTAYADLLAGGLTL